MKYGIVLDELFCFHQTPIGHPERSDRIRTLLQLRDGLEADPRVTLYDTARATRKQLLRVHRADHIARIEGTSSRPAQQIDADTHTSADSFEVARHAAGSAVVLTEAILDGRLGGGFAMIRPPGHHAETGRAMGFCLFNNVAVAAQAALDRAGVERVAIVDFDVHHGNGTQEIFWARDEVLYISTHQYPHYPGTGAFSEVGVGAGKGFSVNFPVPAGREGAWFLDLYQRYVRGVIEQFQPGLLLVSAGFDAHRRDPLAGINLETEDFAEIARILNQIARQCCDGRILYLLEGGYDLPALYDSTAAVVETLLGEETPSTEVTRTVINSDYRRSISEALGDCWDVD